MHAADIQEIDRAEEELMIGDDDKESYSDYNPAKVI